MENVPKPLLVFVVLALGVIGFFFIQRPHSVCDSQKQVFVEAQKGRLFAAEIKGQKKMPVYGRYLESCKLGNSPGACYELFNLMRAVIRDLEAAPLNCLPEFSDVVPIQKSLGDSIELLSLLAWGNKPPEPGIAKYGWLEASDLNLFCKSKKFYNLIFGPQKTEELRRTVQSRFPGEEVIVEDGVCLNCESKKTAEQMLSDEEIWVRSIFSIRCEQF